MKIVMLGLLASIHILQAQSLALPLSVKEKFQYHARQTAGLGGVAGLAAYAGVLQAMDSPREWPGGAAGYGRRVASAAGSSAIRQAIAFSLDTALKQEPRYSRRCGPGFLARVGRAASAVLVTSTDGGGRSIAVWRLGSAYTAAWLSNYWYPERYRNAPSALQQGSLTLAGDLVTNLASEFWPDIRRKLFHRRKSEEHP